MGSNKISDHVESKSPPNSSKNVTREVATHKAYRVINFWKVLKHKHDQQYTHHLRN